MVGDQAAIGTDPSIPVPDERLLLHGYEATAPLFTMLCTVHEADPQKVPYSASLEFKYAALQLQLLYAHWQKIDAFNRDHPNYNGEIREGRRRSDGRKNDIKMANDPARAVRKLQSNYLNDWLRTVNTLCLPCDFVAALKASPAKDGDTRRLYETIANYCMPGYTPGKRGIGGERSSYRRFPYTVDYMGRRFGLLTGPEKGEDNGSGSALEHIVRNEPPSEKNKKKSSLDRQKALALGLDPIEFADGTPFVLGQVAKSEKRRDAQDRTRAQTRGFEIDRRLFPWNSQTIRLEEFQARVGKKLRDILQDGEVPVAELAAASAIAVVAETGRSLDQVLDLRFEENPHSAFAYCPPAPGQTRGLWKWDETGPIYESERPYKSDVEVERAKYLTYPASKIATGLIERYVRLRPVVREDRRLFPYHPSNFRKLVRGWLEKSEVDERINPTRVSHLMWNLLHKRTGGELASICLVLGLHHPMAQVELFYAVLADTEAASLFAESQAVLWGDVREENANPDPTADPPGARFTGCREFPRIEKVREVIDWLREGSEAFFHKPLAEFDTSKHREILTCAVMYGVWHQFFSFATRAITDAYQPLGSFSKSTGIGVLSDKDFVNNYKTRIVVAGKVLRQHMITLEKRLAKVCQRHFHDQLDDLGPVWLLDEQNRPVAVTPSSIEIVLQKKFPLPVNTPRKVIRYLLRKRGMSHSHAENFMGHWWHGREPFSPFSSFDFRVYLAELDSRMPKILKADLRFWPVPGVRVK